MAHHPLLVLGFVLSLNIFSSCGTIFINKYLFQFLDFKFGTFLTVCHFFFAHLCTHALKNRLFTPHSSLSIRQILPISLAFCGYVVFNNISLLHNSVSFYQVMKLLCTPTIILIEQYFYNKSTDRRLFPPLIIVLLGVFVTVFTDLEINLIGTLFAIVAIGSNSVYTVFGKEKQSELKANAMQILHLQSITSALILCVCVPFLDDMSSFLEYEWDIITVLWVLLSCCTAFLVNLSFFLLVGKTSPLTTNVVGYFKTCVVFIGGIVLFSTDYTIQNLSGIFFTLVGVGWYTQTNYRISQEAKEGRV